MDHEIKRPSAVYNFGDMVSEMDEDIEARRQRLADLLDYSAELTQRTNETLAQPRVEMTYQPPRQVRSHDADRIEHELNRRLKTIEVGLSDRIDALEARLAQGFDDVRFLLGGLAEEAGGSLGEVDRKLRKEVESLRSEVTLLRAQANTPARRQKSASRAPWKVDDENSSLRN
jgi:F0F1-type ATP synthase membrane subunit b/b'